MAAVHEFFKNGRILKQLNHVDISIIPKSKHAASPNELRPVSCCNVVYKTITKLLANRIAPLIPKLIDPTQGAFIEERLMNENILLALQLVRIYGRTSCTPRCMMMVDIRKAFDTLSWDFLHNILLGLGFPSIMISWTMDLSFCSSYGLSL